MSEDELDAYNRRRQRRRAAEVVERFVLPVAVGAGHGLMARALFGADATSRFLEVMTASFIFAVPFSLGFVTVALAQRRVPMTWIPRLSMAVVSGLLALAASLALAWEGLICIFLWLPLYVGLSLLGGLLAGAIADARRRSGKHGSGATLPCIALLPYLAGPIETRLGTEQQVRTIENTIRIEATSEAIWKQIERVPRFEEHEHHFALSHAIGFPRPLEATLSHEGVGGVRHATFEGSVLFVETITHWEPPRKLVFSIHADADTIPPHTLDQHVTVGGPHFDVLEGEYELEPLADGAVLLHLRSRHRVSTHFNFYATLWTDFIMADVQSYILEIVRRRAEAAD
ncbi:MAG: hypothetical protein FJ298_12685 [Planctomycetes bacterium]|nr:hypothetical protein [Planctomycetota bacterium]